MKIRKNIGEEVKGKTGLLVFSIHPLTRAYHAKWLFPEEKPHCDIDNVKS